MSLIRIVLIGLIIYLISKIFARYFEITKDTRHESEHEKGNTSGRKKISKDTGEFVDYEEIDT